MPPAADVVKDGGGARAKGSYPSGTGNHVGQPVMFGIAPRFPQFCSTGKYASLAAQSKPIASPPNIRIL